MDTIIILFRERMSYTTRFKIFLNLCSRKLLFSIFIQYIFEREDFFIYINYIC